MVVRGHPENAERHLNLLKWGLLPYWSKDPAKAQRPINARAETVGSSGMFRAAFKARRCIVPADAFYEWKATETGKQPYAIARQDDTTLAFAGLWESFRWPDSEEVTRSFTIVTTTPNAEMSALHSRMPVILEEPDWPVWLGEIEGDHAALMRPAPDGALRTWPVSRAVNTARNNRADLLEPVAVA
jgi:putative SOS response-associated peptidase YedK